MSIYLAPISRGLGDLIICLPILHSLMAQGNQTYLITRCHLQEGLDSAISGLAGSIKESDFKPDTLPAADRFINLRDHRLQRDHVWGTAEFKNAYGNIGINDIQDIICRDYGLSVDFKHLKKLPFRLNPQAQNKIIFVPGSGASYKSWPGAHWLELKRLLSGQGWEIALLGQTQQSPAVANLVASGLPLIPTPTILDALDAVSSCRGVVAVDTGLMHLAVHQQIPTVALFRDYSLFYRPYSHTQAFIAGACPRECAEQMYWDGDTCQTQFTSWQPDPNFCRLPEAQKCLSEISPQQVMSGLLTLMSKQLTRA